MTNLLTIAAPLLGHAGHWLVSVLYVTPVVLVVGALAFFAIRDRGSADAPSPDPEDQP
jgi:hypothetical protein